jgi:hypothetical protein
MDGATSMKSLPTTSSEHDCFHGEPRHRLPYHSLEGGVPGPQTFRWQGHPHLGNTASGVLSLFDN